MVVLSPGVPIDLPIVEEMKAAGVKIWGEIELAYNCGKGRVVAITGTNGKTTTTALTGEIMKNYFESVFVVGNIGTPYTSVVDKMTDDTVTVAEISSFQLETIENFGPVASAILNITPDHLNRHKTMENYIAVKESITKNQSASDTCILNYEDEILRNFGIKLNTKVIFFSSQNILKKGIYLENENIVYNDGKNIDIICKTTELKLLGRHNHENVMAAVALAISVGVPIKIIRNTVMKFEGVEHRIEFVTEKDGVAYYNDSKGTNPDAAIKGIQAMNRPTVLIGGGYDKKSEYEEWIQSFDGKVKYLVLIGQTKELIAEAAKRCGFHDIIFAKTLEEAVTISAEKADKGDAVLLSPACASWGMFSNYEERGRMFKEYVRNL
jgi:UDP-N-acetylmuramoylalanine--D-glutamate ligase